MKPQRVGIIMNGVTGRMGRNQHLARSIAAIRNEGGIEVDGTLVIPDPILVGRDADRLRALASQFGISRFSTDLTACLESDEDSIYFDAQTTTRRADALAAAIEAGKDVYAEKPVATTSRRALELAALAEDAGVRNGAVQDKLFLPGLLKLSEVINSGVLGRLLSARIDFGYWVFPDAVGPTQRPSWNYRSEDGGGIVLDMFCHFHYLLENLVGAINAVWCTTKTHIPTRISELGRPYAATADDAAYAIFELEGGIVAPVTASWCVRPHREDLFVIQVDGVDATAVADLRRCLVQPGVSTPRFVWNPDIPMAINPKDGWLEIPQRTPPVNAFRRQWELFLRHHVAGEPFPWSLRRSAAGVELAELALRSAAEQRRIEVP